jgi:excisionase family DNA binding protein
MPRPRKSATPAAPAEKVALVSKVVPAAMSVRDAAAYLGVSRATLYRVPNLPKVKIGARVVITRASLDAILESGAATAA